MLDSCKMVEKQSEAFHMFLWHFPSLKQNFIAYRSSKVSSRPDCIFEIPKLWQSGFSRVYSNCCCSYSFEPEIIKIGQSSHKMYSKNILNACIKKSGNLLNAARIYSNSATRCRTSSIFKRKKTGLNSVFFLDYLKFQSQRTQPFILLNCCWDWRRRDRFMPFPKA